MEEVSISANLVSYSQLETFFNTIRPSISVISPEKQSKTTFMIQKIKKSRIF